MKHHRKKTAAVFLGIVVLLAALGCARTMTAKGEPDKNRISAFSGQEPELLNQDTELLNLDTELLNQDTELLTQDTETPVLEAEEDAAEYIGDEAQGERRETEAEEPDQEVFRGYEMEKQGTSCDTGYIFLGDSRIYLMNEDCGIGKNANFFTVCSPGMGYDWMISEGLPKLKNIQKRHTEIKNWVVVSALGINDMHNVNKYISAYRKLAKSVELWLVSVNPTMGRTEPEYSNVCIEAFNKRLRKLDGVSYMDSYGYLVQKGYDTKDGVHYTEATNWDIYSYILNSLAEGKDCAPAQDTDARELAGDLAGQLSRGEG